MDKMIYVVYDKKTNKEVYTLDKYPIYVDNSCNIIGMTLKAYDDMHKEKSDK